MKPADSALQADVDVDAAAQAAIDRVITCRRSTRRFVDRPVSRQLLVDILALAGRAPSNSNMQPWRICLAAGAIKERLAQAISEAHRTAPDDHQPERPMFAPDMPQVSAARRQRFGQIFFGTLGIDAADAAGRARQSARNFVFFDAPVVAFFTVDRRLEAGSWLDCGLFAQTFMLAAKARGLDTCAQIALTKYHAIVRRHLPIDDAEVVACGMSIGYADRRSRENTVRMPRVPVEEFATLVGFAS
jgi:nitroreductase